MIFALGLLASMGLVALTLVRGQKPVALVSMWLSLVLGVQFYLMDQLPASALSVVALVIAGLLFFTIGKTDPFSRFLDSNWGKTSIVVAYVLGFTITNGGITLDVGLLALIGGTLTAAVAMVKNVWLARLLLACSGVCWTIFQIQTGAWTNLIGQAFYFAGLVWMSCKDLKKTSPTVLITATIQTKPGLA